MNQAIALQPYQTEVRNMLIIDARIREILTEKQRAYILSLGLQFGPQPQKDKETFFICSIQRNKANISIYEAMVKYGPQFFYYTLDMAHMIISSDGSIVTNIREIIKAMERGWKDSPYYR